MGRSANVTCGPALGHVRAFLRVRIPLIRLPCPPPHHHTSLPQVRNELKEYAHWPTYPQLYVKGELIGARGGGGGGWRLGASGGMRQVVPPQDLAARQPRLYCL